MQQEKIVNMFDKISKQYDLVNRIVSFGIDKKWRIKAIQEAVKYLPKNPKVIDVACGTGDMIEIWQRYTNDICGIDPSKGMLEVAKKRFKNIKFYQAYATNLSIEDNFVDAVSISFGIRNVIDIKDAIKEFRRVLKENGILIILEFTKNDNNSILRNGVDFYSNKILPFIASIFSDKEAYEYLPNSIENFYTQDELCSLLEGFEILEKRYFNFRQVSLIIAQKK